MDINYLTPLKGFMTTLLALIGVTILTENSFLHIYVKEGSISWYTSILLIALSIINGVYKIYSFIRKKIRYNIIKNI